MKLRRGGRAAFAFALLIAACVVGAADAPLPKPIGLVSDFAGVVDAATEERITRLLEELRAKTGAEVAVVTVDSTGDEAPFDYAMRLAEAWKPGNPAKDEGVLFLVAVRDHKTQIVTGYGAEGALPDGKVGEILDGWVVPEFRRGDLARGIENGARAIAAVLAREHGVALSERAPPAATSPARVRMTGAEWLVALLLLGVAAFLFVQNPMLAIMLLGGHRGRRFGGGFGGGGFGGFGGGGFGGGGAGRSW
ncbi:MAG: uncharacterized protein QOD06_157 [Candidatus Binatota bacterium]|jgi:uncharacterized protein|nr:uncharacterized protein [Candidatus Binatota bacterium]